MTLKRCSVWISFAVCGVVVLLTSWPSIQNPRLEGDDYRYLDHILQWKSGQMGLVETMTVENRWDHLWFMQEEGVVRFFRPTVVLSYAVDQFLWGENYPTGLAVSNALIHLLCSLLAACVLHRVMGPGVPGILSSALFAGLAAHSECIWYIAGRTDSLAALGFLAALGLHLSGKRWWALPCFAFGFITKEMVVAAPVLFLFFDVRVERKKPDWKMYAGYAATAGLVLLLKRIALGGTGSDFVYPYLISPLSAEFPRHLWLQLQSYLGNLFAAEATVPFADTDIVAQLHSWWVLAAGLVFILGSVWCMWRDRRMWFFLALGVLTWLPTSFVYLSERYLYLPSLAFAGFLGLLAVRVAGYWKWALCLVLGGYTVFQSVQLHQRIAAVIEQPGSVNEVISQIEPVRSELNDVDELLLVNFPGQFVRAQFAQELFRVILNRPDLKVDVLTMMPGQNGVMWSPGDPLPVMGAGVQLRWNDPDRLTLLGSKTTAGTAPHSIQEYGMKRFDWTPLETGVRRSCSSFDTYISAAGPSGAEAIEFTFNPSSARRAALVWRADCSDLNEHPWIRRKQAQVALIRPGE